MKNSTLNFYYFALENQVDVNEVAIPAISAAGGGLSAVWLAKVLITSWLKRYDIAMQDISSLTKDMAVTLHRLKTIENDINGLGQSLRSAMCKAKE